MPSGVRAGSRHKDGRGGHGSLVGPVNEPVVPLDSSPVALAAYGTDAYRSCSIQLSNRHQTGGRAGIAECGGAPAQAGTPVPSNGIETSETTNPIVVEW